MKYRFPVESVQKGSKIILYGAGCVGRCFCDELLSGQYCDLLFVIDRQHEKIKSLLGVPVYGIEAAMTSDFDYIVVAVSSANIAKEIQQKLVQAGIEPAKIIFEHVSFNYSPPEVDQDQFRIATCNDLIWLKSRHREFFSVESTDYSKKHYGLGWGLKALGYYYILEYMKRFRPARVLEIGAGMSMFFSDRCRELGLEYWMCDDGHFYSDEAIQKHTNRQGTTFIYGQVGQYLEALPANYFDLILSVSVVEHVPLENLNDFYSDIRRMIKKPAIDIDKWGGGDE